VTVTTGKSTVLSIFAEAEKIPFPHAARRVVEADAFMIHVWIGNEKLPNVHRNIDVDELWIHMQGPPITVTSTEAGPEKIVLNAGEMVLLPRGAVHTSDAAAEPRAVVAIVEKTIHEYPRWPVADADRLDSAVPMKMVDLRQEIASFTPPWRYQQVELLQADGFVVGLHVRSEGSLVPRASDSEHDHAWLVLKGEIQLETEGEGKGPVLREGDVSLVKRATLYRPVARSKWTAALIIRGR
jgi:quercetin dioxygenase-like cupin family protein